MQPTGRHLPTEAETLPPPSSALLARLAAIGLSGSALLRELSEGASVEELLVRHSRLSRQDLSELLSLAAQLLESLHLPDSVSSDEFATLPPSASTLPVERTGLLPIISGFEVIGLLGEGGMGVVYHARQVGLNRAVALKMLRFAGSGPEAIERFRAEAEALARLQHPGIVQVHAVGESDGGPFFALEFVAGGSLASKLTDRPIPAHEAASLVEQLSRAVHAAHEAGVIHRDLKPENVLVTEDGQPKVTDFGLAKLVESDTGHTKTGEVLGTPSYMAPEQAEGKQEAIGPRTDVYALGAILYRLLTGRPPYRGTTSLDTVLQVVEGNLTPPRILNPDLPRDLQTITLRALRRSPDGRYGSARALADDLRRFLAGDAIRARPERPEERLWRWARRHPVPAVIRGMTGVLLAVWFTYTIVSGLILYGALLPVLTSLVMLLLMASGLTARKWPTLLTTLLLVIPLTWLFLDVPNSPHTRDQFTSQSDRNVIHELRTLDRVFFGAFGTWLRTLVILPLMGGAVVGALWRGWLILRLGTILLAWAVLGLFLAVAQGDGLTLLAVAGLLGLICRLLAWVIGGRPLDAFCGAILGIGLVGLVAWTAGPGQNATILMVLAHLCPVAGAILGALASRQSANRATA